MKVRWMKFYDIFRLQRSVMDIVSEHNAAVAKNKVSFALLIITERSDGRSSNFKL